MPEGWQKSRHLIIKYAFRQQTVAYFSIHYMPQLPHEFAFVEGEFDIEICSLRDIRRESLSKNNHDDSTLIYYREPKDSVDVRNSTTDLTKRQSKTSFGGSDYVRVYDALHNDERSFKVKYINSVQEEETANGPDTENHGVKEEEDSLLPDHQTQECQAINQESSETQNETYGGMWLFIPSNCLHVPLSP